MLAAQLFNEICEESVRMVRRKAKAFGQEKEESSNIFKYNIVGIFVSNSMAQ
jgi:hypothetical protein